MSAELNAARSTYSNRQKAEAKNAAMSRQVTRILTPPARKVSKHESYIDKARRLYNLPEKQTNQKAKQGGETERYK